MDTAGCMVGGTPCALVEKVSSNEECTFFVVIGVKDVKNLVWLIKYKRCDFFNSTFIIMQTHRAHFISYSSIRHSHHLVSGL